MQDAGKKSTKKGVCHICGAGEGALPLLTLYPYDLLIAADDGLSKLTEAGLTPNIIIGDFDSHKEKLLSDIPVIRLPVRKDVTDMAAAVSYGEAAGYRTFYLYGATGGRPDHTYANYQLVAGMSRRGLSATIVDGVYRMTAVTDGTFCLPKTARGTVSIFAHGGIATGVTLTDLSYPLADACLSPDVPLGISNEVVADCPTVSVRQGCLLIMWEEK